MRTAISIVALTGLVVTLAACSPANPEAADCDVTPSGSVSSSIKVTGDFGSKPEVTFTSPTKVATTERSVVIESDGDIAQVGDIVKVQYSLYNGGTGAELEASDYTDAGLTSFPVDIEQLQISGIVDTLRCAAVGSRVVGVIPPAEGFAENGAQLGLAETDDLVFVVDIDSIEEAPAPLEPKAWTENVPEVDLTADIPVVTLPDTDPSPDMLIKVIEEGDGDVVAAGDSVTINYQGTSWDTGEIFDQSYGKEPATFGTDQVIEGFGAALVGQKVGTTLIVSIPPQYAYGTDPAAAELGGQTLVFLIEIISVA